MDKLRLRFEKTGRAVYISHLDLMTTMQRGFARAGYRLKYSEGFNPHPLISILLPLSVGAASLCELMDFRLAEDADLHEMPVRLSGALPEGLRILEAYEQTRKSAELKWLRIKGEFEYDERDPVKMAAGLQAFFARDQISIMKKTKRGTGEADIRPAIRKINFDPSVRKVDIITTVSAQEPTLNPELLVSSLRQLQPDLTPDFARFTRLETFDADMKVYR